MIKNIIFDMGNVLLGLPRIPFLTVIMLKGPTEFS